MSIDECLCITGKFGDKAGRVVVKNDQVRVEFMDDSLDKSQ